MQGHPVFLMLPGCAKGVRVLLVSVGTAGLQDQQAKTARKEWRNKEIIPTDRDLNSEQEDPPRLAPASAARLVPSQALRHPMRSPLGSHFLHARHSAHSPLGDSNSGCGFLGRVGAGQRLSHTHFCIIAQGLACTRSLKR